MRYLVRFVFVLVLVALPQRVSAQAGEAATASEPSLEESAPSSEPAPEKPALQLQLDSAGVDVAPSPPRTADGYTLEEMELRVKRARIGLGVSALSTVVGIALSGVAGANAICFFDPCSVPGWVYPVVALGGVLAVGGIVGMGVSGSKLRRRNRDRNSLREAHYGKPRRVQWDSARRRLVF
jgi:hypothetical protein